MIFTDDLIKYQNDLISDPSPVLSYCINITGHPQKQRHLIDSLLFERRCLVEAVGRTDIALRPVLDRIDQYDKVIESLTGR
jgi:hypothetical protein